MVVILKCKRLLNIKFYQTIFLYRSVGKDSFEKFGIDYPKILENEVPKSSKLSATKITNFLTPQSQNEKTLSNKYVSL